MTAALALAVLGLGLVGCGSPRMAALHADCTTKSLRWKLTILKKKPHTAHRDARLSIVNKSAQPCVFRGFPLFEVHVGKGPESDAEGHGTTLPIDLRRGGTVTTALRYKDIDPEAEKSAKNADKRSHPGMPSAGCLVGNDTAVVAAPRDPADRRAITARDEKGKPSLMNICEDTIAMGPPREVAE